MNTKQHKKLVQAGGYIAEVDIELIESDGGWSPYLSLDDSRTCMKFNYYCIQNFVQYDDSS